MAANSFAAGDLEGLARGMGVKTISVPLKVALAVSRNAWMFGALYLFNHIVNPDDEANNRSTSGTIRTSPSATRAMARRSPSTTSVVRWMTSLNGEGSTPLLSQNISLYGEGKMSART